MKIGKSALKRFAPWIVVLAIPAILAPLMPDDVIDVFVFANIYALWTVSWDAVGGITGYISFGHGVMFGLPAYVSFMLILHAGLPLYAAVILGVVVGIAASTAFFLPSLRIKGLYFTLATLLVLFIVDRLIIYFRDYTGGTLGIWGVPNIVNGLMPHFYLSLICLGVVGIIMWYEFRVRLREVYISIRESEDLLANVGISPTKFKLYMFMWASLAAALGGVIMGHYMGAIAPSTFFGLKPILLVIIMAIVGGFGTLWGGVIGAYLIQIILWILRPYHLGAVRFVIFGIVALAFIYILPGGIGPTIRDGIMKLFGRGKAEKAEESGIRGT